MSKKKTWALVFSDPTNGPSMFTAMAYPPEPHYFHPFAPGEIYSLPVSDMYYMCYPLFSSEWDLVVTLARERNVEELEWLIRLLVISDPYSDEALSPLDRVFPYAPDEYWRIVAFLMLLCADVDEDEADFPNMMDATHGLTEDDFIYLDP